MDSEEELVPEGSVRDGESVKDSEISLKSQGDQPSEASMPGFPKPASFSPVLTPDKDDMSLKSAQSENLSGDSHKVLSPMPKTLAGPSVKDFPLKAFFRCFLCVSAMIFLISPP